MKKFRSPLPPLKTLSAALATCFAVNAQALPTAPTVSAGNASFQQSGNSLTVTNSNGTIINWNSFSVGAGESTRFIQPTASSSVLNRVLGGDPSQIYGTLSSNGRIYLVNPNGIFVGPGGRVDAAAFVASTLALADQDFLAGRLAFTRVGAAGAVENQGVITTPEGGSVYLIGSQVDNRGSIAAPNGEVVLAAGQSVQLVNTGTPGVTVEFSASDESVQNFGSIAAGGGRIGLAGALVRNSGSLSASSVVREGGRIFLRASQQVEVDAAGRIVANGTQGGTVELKSDDLTLVSGQIEAKGSVTAGGRVEVLGDKVGVFDGASIDASGQTGGGAILVGGDYQGKNPEIQNAFVSWFGAGARLRANATENGDGGRIIVWADDTTRAYGQTEAMAGANGGNGGLIEVSGKRYLDYQGIANTSAPNGKNGTLLLDPMDISIVDDYGGDFFYGAGFTGTGPFVFEAASSLSSAQITWGTISNQLQYGSVIISTSSPYGTGTGDISVNGSWYAGGFGLNITHPQDVGFNTANYFGLLNTPNDLTLLANNDIFVNATFGNAGTGSVNLYAGWDGVSSPTAPILSNAYGDIFVSAVVASQGSQDWGAPGQISISSNGTGGAGIDIDTGTLTMKAGNIGLFAGSETTQIGGISRSAFISGNGSQSLIIDGGSLTVAGGSSSLDGSYGDRAYISQHGGAGSQSFSFYGGADLLVQAGSTSGSTNLCYGSSTVFCDDQSANIRNFGTGGQTLSFFAPGSSITLQGGNGGVGNWAGIENENGAQTITWVGSSANAPSLTILGGYGGAFDSALTRVHSNDAGISSDSLALQTIRASSITIDARSIAIDVGHAGAYLAAANQDISATGDLSLYGGASSVSGIDGGTTFDGGMAVVGWDVSSNVTISAGGSVFVGSGGLAYGSAGIGALQGNSTIVIDAANVTVDGAFGAGSSSAAIGSRTGTANIDLNVGTFNVFGGAASPGQLGSIDKTGTLSITATGTGGINLGAGSQLRANVIDLSAQFGGGTSIFQDSNGVLQSNLLIGSGNLNVQFFGVANDAGALQLSSTTGQSLYYGGSLSGVFAQSVSGYGGVTISSGGDLTLGSISAANGSASISAAYGIFEANGVGNADISALGATLFSAYGSLGPSTLAISADVDLAPTGTLSASVSPGATYGGISIRSIGADQAGSVSLIDNALSTTATVEYSSVTDLILSGSLSSAYGSVLISAGTANLDLTGASVFGAAGVQVFGGTITASSFNASTAGLFQANASGAVDLSGSNVSADTVAISGSGLTMTGGSLSSTVGGVALNAGTGLLDASPSSISSAGTLDLSGGAIALGAITANSASAITISAANGVTATGGSYTASSGDVLVDAGTGNLLSDAAFISPAGSVSLKGALLALSSPTLFGSTGVALNGSSGIAISGGSISSASGAVTATSSSGAVVLSGASISAASASLSAGSLLDLASSGINTSGAIGLGGGAIQLTASSISSSANAVSAVSGSTVALDGASVSGATGVAVSSVGNVALSDASLIGGLATSPGDVTVTSSAGAITLDNGASIVADNANSTVKLFAATDISLSNGSRIMSGNDVYLTLQGSTAALILNGSSHVLADTLSTPGQTIYLDFLGRSSGGIVIDGVATSTWAAGGSGLFTGNLSTVATQGFGLVTNYVGGVDPVASEIGTIFDTGTRDTESINNLKTAEVQELAAEMTEEEESGEAQENNANPSEGNEDGSGKSKPAQCT